MTGDLPTVDVVILTWNDTLEARRAAASVAGSTGVQARIVVVDNGSEPPFEAGGDVELLRLETNLGVAGGRNHGIQAGRAPFVAVLDSDAILSPHSLARLLEPLLAEQTIGLSVPVYCGMGPWETAGRHPTLARKLIRGLRLTRQYQPMRADPPWWDVEFGIGACQLFRRTVYEEIGGIQPQGLFGPEDVEFCRRIREAGHRVVQVSAPDVSHDPRRAWRSPFSRRGRHHLVSVLRYYRGLAHDRSARRTA